MFIWDKHEFLLFLSYAKNLFSILNNVIIERFYLNANIFEMFFNFQIKIVIVLFKKFVQFKNPFFNSFQETALKI